MSFRSWFSAVFNPHVPEMTEADIRTIHAMYASGTYTQAEIGQRLGIHQSQVSRILARERRRGSGR